MIKVFEPGNYSFEVFYKFMGPFFGERKYKRELPYLVNTENTWWFIELKDELVTGFSSYEITNQGVEIGDTFVVEKDLELWGKLAMYALDAAESLGPKRIYVAVTFEVEQKWYEAQGFEVYRETKNYIFLEKVDEDGQEKENDN
ncbi:hypothetical protein [Listeria booriae]|uniref:hypothetical protein n=1 Tax=Listeria booriae TaxID=1552123 RepID=UPI0016273544|nr:hypothetical protein [Listeria booriae]MBC2173899.1 hypothetical protein [Listeria booriae]